MPLFIRSEITGIRTGEYKEKKFAVLQFSEDVGDGSVRFMEVNLPDDTDPSQFKRGQQIDLQLRISAKDSKIYYRAIAATPQPAARPNPKP